MTFLPRLATAELEHAVSLNQHDTGALYVWGETATGARAEFLLDTGATMVTVTRAFFRELKRDARVEARGKVAARLANGSYQVMETYLVDGLRVGGTCEVGPVEVAVLPGKGRNILGLSALAAHAPFAVHLAPPKLALSGCAMGPVAGEALAATP